MKIYKRSKTARQPNGFTVVQTLMTASVVFIISGAFLANQAYMRKSQSRMAAGVSRSSLAEVLHFNASSPLMIYRSSLRGTDVQQSSPLVACICGESGCQKDQERSFDLVDSEGRILAGENPAKMKYNTLSEFCQQLEESIEVPFDVHHRSQDLWDEERSLWDRQHFFFGLWFEQWRDNHSNRWDGISKSHQCFI